MLAEPCLPISFVDQLVRRILDGSKTQTRRLINPQPHPLERGWWEWGYKLGAPKATSPRNCVWHGETWQREAGSAPLDRYGPYRVGDRLWVRESYALIHPKYFRQEPKRPGHVCRVQYLADGAERMVTLTEQERAKLEARRSPYTKAQPGRFLYKSCARIFLRVTTLRAERLQDITEEDAKAEGLIFIPFEEPHPHTGLKGWWCGGPHPVKGTPRVFPTARAAFIDLWDWVHRKRQDAQSKANPWLWVPGFQLEQVLVRGAGRAA